MASTPYSADPTLYLYTSLTAGSSHIITATSRLETILKANKIPFRALDVATDEKARMLWGRRCKGRKLPGLVKFGTVIGDLDEIEEWNEYGELKQQITAVSDIGGTPSKEPIDAPPKSLPPLHPDQRAKTFAETRHISISEPMATHDSGSTTPVKKDENPFAAHMRQAVTEAAQRGGERQNADHPKFHRGRSISNASKEEAAAIEAAYMIPEEDESENNDSRAA